MSWKVVAIAAWAARLDAFSSSAVRRTRVCVEAVDDQPLVGSAVEEDLIDQARSA